MKIKFGNVNEFTISKPSKGVTLLESVIRSMYLILCVLSVQ
jgi:hypothetical protein